jgi:hypothetical protein
MTYNRLRSIFSNQPHLLSEQHRLSTRLHQILSCSDICLLRKTLYLYSQQKKVQSMRYLLIIVFAFLTACTGKPSFTDKTLDTSQKLNLEEFFNGELVAYGQFQDVLGTVRRSFVVNIKGDWDGETLTLVEDFDYEDGSTEQRIWSLTKTGDDSWTGTAPGVIGMATGIEQDNRFNWQYEIDLPIPAADGTTETLRVTFDDWMWLLSEDRLFNRAYVKRFGLDIGDVSISFEKLR